MKSLTDWQENLLEDQAYYQTTQLSGGVVDHWRDDQCLEQHWNLLDTCEGRVWRVSPGCGGELWTPEPLGLFWLARGQSSYLPCRVFNGVLLHPMTRGRGLIYLGVRPSREQVGREITKTIDRESFFVWDGSQLETWADGYYDID